jgi:hypothetical protein
MTQLAVSRKRRKDSMRFINVALFLVLFLSLAAPALAAAGAPTPLQRMASAGRPAMFALRLPAAAATDLPPTVDQTVTPAAGATDANGTFIAALIIWVVIIILVAVTAFLVWRTRPRR